MKIKLKICLFVITCLFFVPAIKAFELPLHTVIEQMGKNVVFYTVGGKRYRFVELATLPNEKAGIPIAFTIKLRERLGRELLAFGDVFDNARIILEPGVMLAKEVSGTNLLLCGVRVVADAKSLSFKISASALMPGDLDLFVLKKKTLLENKNASCEDFFLLGDWLDLSKKQSQIEEEAEFESYRRNADWAYGEALRRLTSEISALPAAVAKGIEKCQRFVSLVGKAPPGRASAIVAQYYQQLLDLSAPLIKVSKAGAQVSDKQAVRFAVIAYVQVAGIYDELLADKNKSRELLLKAGKLEATNNLVTEGLSKFGYVLHKGSWMSKKKQQQIILQSKKSNVQKTAPHFKQARQMDSESIKLKRELAEGKGVEKALLDVNFLLGLSAGKGLEELAGGLDGYPLDVARYAVFSAVSWYAVDADKVVEAALNSKYKILRQDAVSLLVKSFPASANKVLAIMGSEKDIQVVKYYVDALWQIPGAGGIGSMITILSRKAISKVARKRALKYLQNESGEKTGLDAFVWKRWWNNNRLNYKRKPVKVFPPG